MRCVAAGLSLPAKYRLPFMARRYFEYQSAMPWRTPAMQPAANQPNVASGEQLNERIEPSLRTLATFLILEAGRTGGILAGKRQTRRPACGNARERLGEVPAAQARTISLLV